MDNTFFVYAEDLVAVLIGPFASREAADEHIRFCAERGDGATASVVDATTAARFSSKVSYRLTPQEDRDYVG